MQYPSIFWQAQLAIVESERGGFYVRGADTTFKFKRMEYESNPRSFGLSFGTRNHAPWDTLTTAESITWRFNTYAGDWCVPAQIYRDWMEEAFHPWRIADMPSWVGNIGLIATVHVVHANIDILDELAKFVDPTKTLLSFTNWRVERHDVNHPDYSNASEKFERLLEAARQHGFRVMLHVNIHNCSPLHPLYQELKQFQYRHPHTGEVSGWLWDDIGNPKRNAHISLASSQFRNHLIQEFKAVWEKYKVDVFFLDVSHYVLNDANGLIEGLTSAEGNILFHHQLIEALPGVVFGGEHLHEVNFFRETFVKRYSKTEAIHPLSAFLFSPYIRPHGGNGTPGIFESHYIDYLHNAEQQGFLPTMWTWNKKLLNEPLAQQVLATARRRQELGLQPSINCNWDPNTLFQYTAQTGETVTLQQTNGTTVFIVDNPDLNRDGVVNVLDLVLLSNKFGQQVPQATIGDLNGDGVINILDLTIVARAMNNAP